MKACVIQPPYTTDFSKADEHFKYYIDFLDKCDSSMDIIVLPESSDIPALSPTPEQRKELVDKFNKALLDKASETAVRCDAVVFVNARFLSEIGYVNTTYAINRQGEIVGKYFKEHPVPNEVAAIDQDTENAFVFDKPYTVTIDGIKYAFLTCYDFYFYENYPQIAKEYADIIIGCSHQRSDTHRALEIITQFLAYNTNTYVLRSSVSMDENSDIGGGSMIVAPTGEILCNLKSKVAMGTAEFDPKNKYYKPAGYGNPPAAHFEYIEQGRKPWKYRPAGPAIIKNDEFLPYPRTCAHRGFNTIAPENTMPAFGAAVAMGAEEIEFDLWFTKDGEVVSAHDPELDRVSNGTGKIWEHTLAELKELDFGCKYSDEFKGLKIPTFEEILEKFACHTIMNIHLKTEGQEDWHLSKVFELIKKYDCENYVYIMSGCDKTLERIGKEYPHIKRCCGAGDGFWEIVERAIKLGCEKVQFYDGYFNEEMVKKAKEHGIKTNVFWADYEAKARQFLDWGVECILTNDYNRISQIVNEYKNK